MIIPIVAAIGFICAIMTFSAGFRMVRKPEQGAEVRMHKINGIITLILYIILFVLSVVKGTSVLNILAWSTGFGAYYLKLVLVKKGLAIRYGGYLGAILIITWIIVIYNHLPK